MSQHLIAHPECEWFYLLALKRRYDYVRDRYGLTHEEFWLRLHQDWLDNDRFCPGWLCVFSYV